MTPANRLTNAAWALLVATTLLTFWMTAHLDTQMAAIAAGMLLASVKVFVVLRYFMASDRLTLPLKIFVYGWAIGCSAMILGIAWFTD